MAGYVYNPGFTRHATCSTVQHVGFVADTVRVPSGLAGSHWPVLLTGASYPA